MSLEDNDVTIEDLVEAARLFGCGDVAVAIEKIEEGIESGAFEGDIEDVADEVTMPFYEDDRQNAFAFGLTAGAVLERDYGDEDPNVELADLPDEGGQQIEAETTQSQSQSVRLDR